MTLRPLVFALAAALTLPISAQAAKYTYHGDLMDGDVPAEGAYDLRVRGLAQPGATKTLGEATELPGVKLSGGRFSVELDVPEDTDGTTWVEVAVRKAGSNDPYEKLGDPQPIAKVNSTCPGAWALDGNSGMPIGSYLGTADFVPVEVRANGVRAAHFAPGGAINRYGDAAIVTLGSSANIASGAGATVGGGGATLTAGGVPNATLKNEALGDFSTVGGGIGSKANADWSTVGGGQTNLATENYAVVAGGRSNRASGLASVVSGGDGNLATGFRSGVTGGSTNLALGTNSTVGGGQDNLAGAARSFAAGNYARVRIAGAPPATLPPNLSAADYTGLNGGDEGSFVWSSTDFANDFFRSSGRNQFLIRARGGVGINTNAPGGAALTVAQPNPADSGNTIRLRTSTRSSEWSVYEPDGATALISLAGDLRLETGIASKYIYTNDKFGVLGRPTANALEVNGEASKSVAGSWLANSDRRIKTDIAPIPDALDTIMKLRPVTFRYADDYRKAHDSIDDTSYYNVIAQEFAEVFPDAVKGSGEYLPGKSRTVENEILQVDTYPAQIASIAAIQELAVNDDAQREQMTALKRDNAALHQELDALTLRFARLEARQEH